MSLTVNILRGINLHDTSVLGEQHVYCQCRIGMEMQRTEHRYGCNPRFGDSLVFPGGAMQAQQMEIELWANHLTGANLVGRGVMSLIGPEMQGCQTVLVPLFEQNGRQKGELELSVMMMGQGAMMGGGGMMQPQMMGGGMMQPQMMMQNNMMQQQMLGQEMAMGQELAMENRVMQEEMMMQGRGW